MLRGVRSADFELIIAHRALDDRREALRLLALVWDAAGWRGWLRGHVRPERREVRRLARRVRDLEQQSLAERVWE
jgi:hypothetical protein